MPLRTRRSARFTHVVFAGAEGIRPGRVINFTPVPAARDAAVEAADRTPQLTAEEDAFVTQLFEQAGLDGRIYRRETLRRRLPACLRAIRACSPPQGQRILREDPRLVGRAVGMLVIGVTSFFRDAEIFDAIRLAVLPSICAGTSRPCVWSVGCSDGPELYSLAILLDDLNLREGTCLLGTDCRPDAVQRARQGIYETRSLRGVPDVWLKRYFQPVHDEPDRLQVCPDIRAAVQWRTADVARIQEPGQWDLILCRNMAMYLRAESSGRLWRLFEQSLRPGGFLVLGKAERPAGAARLSPVAACVYRRDHS